MADDIVERLQAELDDPHGYTVISATVDADLLRDAKAEIERLRALVDQLAEALRFVQDDPGTDFGRTLIEDALAACNDPWEDRRG